MEYVVLVNEQDEETGIMEKQQAHLEGKLHRAISVFIFNTNGELLLQQRAAGKYHSAGLWTNTCCSHPRRGEPVREAAVRRLYEEMGLHCELWKLFTFTYKADVGENIIEHELDHVFAGITDALPVPDSTEVAAYKYVSPATLKNEINTHPELYTEWFKICCNNWSDELFGNNQNT